MNNKKKKAVERKVTVHPSYGEYKLYFITLTDHLSVDYTRDLIKETGSVQGKIFFFTSPSGHS